VKLTRLEALATTTKLNRPHGFPSRPEAALAQAIEVTAGINARMAKLVQIIADFRGTNSAAMGKFAGPLQETRFEDLRFVA